jgi:hypothetical protein
MRIGFYGDSFCMELANTHSWYYKYTPYTVKVKQHYNAEIVNLGLGGSSYWDVMLKQFPPALENLPDVCIFCWTDSSRVYHPTVRNIGSWVMDKSSILDLHITRLLNYKKYNAAREYFTHLHDREKAERERMAAFLHFDLTVLRLIQEKTKIIHLWSFGNAQSWDQENPYYPENVIYPYRWKNGHEIRPSLKCLSAIGRNTLNDDFASNHLGSEENNTIAANMIIDAIDNYVTGSLTVHTINPTINI